MLNKKSFLTLLLFTGIFIFIQNPLHAQSIVGNWSLDDFQVELTENATEEQKQQFEFAKSMLAMMVPQMKGKVSIELKKDGTYKASSPNEDDSDEPKYEEGTYEYKKGKLKMTNNEGKEENMDIEFINGNMAFLKEEQGMLTKMIFAKK